MYNLMIIEKHPYQLDKILNYICEKFKNIRVCYISYDDKNVLEILTKFTIDLILLDCKTNEIEDISFIDYIQEHNLYQYQKSIIVKTDNDNNIDKYRENKYVFSCSNQIDEINKDIKKLIKYKDYKINVEDIRNKIQQELNKLNYNYSYVGTKYLEEVILELYKVKLEFDGNISKNIYPIVAQRYNKKVDTIYGNIKQATKYMISINNKEELSFYLGYSHYIKPKVQQIIFAVLNKIE